MRTRSITALALASLFAACGVAERAGPRDTRAPLTTSDTGTTTPAACADTGFSITLGQGNETTFDPSDPGELLVLYFGAQGGWHVDAAAMVRGVAPSVHVEVDWTLTVLDEGWVVGDPDQPFLTMLQPYDTATCEGNAYGTLAYLDRLDEVVPGDSAFERGCALDGKPMRLDLKVILADGRTSSASVEGTAAVDLSVVGDCPSR